MFLFNLKDKIRNSEFLKNILILFTGATIAQVIPLVATLLLARMYTNDDFGILSIFNSIIGILATVSALRYDLAIILPKHQKSTYGLVFLSLLNVVCFSIIVYVFFYFFGGELFTSVFKINYSKIFNLVSLAILLFGVYNVLINIFIKIKMFKYVAYSNIFRSVPTATFKLIFGLLSISYGLIYGTIIGYSFSAIYLLFLLVKYENKKVFKFLTLSNIKIQAKNYKDFPLYSVPSSITNSIARLGLPIIIASFYGTEKAGLYFFADSIVRVPLNLVVQSISQAFKEKASKMYVNSDRGLLKFVKKIQLNYVVIVIPIIIVLSIWGGWFFQVVFGDKWILSGEMVKLFCFYLFFGNYFNLISSLIDILRLQKEAFIFNISLAMSQILFFIVFSKYLSFELSLLLISLIGGSHFFIFDSYIKRKLISFK